MIISWGNLEDGTLTHCNTIAIWKDCPDGHDDCYYVKCAICGVESLTDCKE